MYLYRLAPVQVLVAQPEMEALTKLDRTKLWRFVTEVSRRYHGRPVSHFAPRVAIDVYTCMHAHMRTCVQVPRAARLTLWLRLRHAIDVYT